MNVYCFGKMKLRFSRLKCLFVFILLGGVYSIFLSLIAQQEGTEPQAFGVNQVVSFLDLDIEKIQMSRRKEKPHSSAVKSVIEIRPASEAPRDNLKSFKSTINKDIKGKDLKDKIYRLNAANLSGLCPIERLKPEKKTNEEVSCKQHTMSESSCKYVTDKYGYNFEKHTCEGKEIISICQYQKSIKRFQCDYHACGEDYNEDVLIHLMDLRSGIVRPIYQGFRFSEQIEVNVMKYAIKTLEQGNKFIFLSCGFVDNNNNKTQLIILDKDIAPGKKKKKDEYKKPDVTKLLNINVILLDSVSRSHFYRSLKTTINFLRNTTLHSDADILDFELFQSVHGHTTENLYALFNGKLLPTDFTDRDKERMKIQFQELLGYVKKEGYNVLYQEDMCWQGTYGLNTDLGMFLEWEKLFKEFKQNSLIDDPGMSIRNYICSYFKL